MFDEILQESFDDREKGVLEFWKREDIFKQSVEQRRDDEHFAFYDGPPFATGLPHYGHFLAGTIKDVVLRYKTMKGFYAPRRFGWDCHGLPVENEIEKTYNLTGAKSIGEFGIARFNEECRKIVLRYTEEWKDYVLRMGRWVDFENTYRTMDITFMESVWWVFKQLFDKGLVYQGYKVMPFSAKLGTPLSNFEAGENYKEIDDPSLTVSLELEEDPGCFLLIWTTTPWTLISNLGVMVGPDVGYVEVEDKKDKKRYILAEARLPVYFPSDADYSELRHMKGRDLYGFHYRPLFDYFKSLRERGAFRVILEESVSLDEGTGLVHSAPAFGEVDFYACQREGIDPVCPVDQNGKFTEEIPEHAGFFVKDADKDIIKRLKERGKIFQQSVYRHRYPFCWRSDTPLIYRVIDTWFVAVEKIKETLLEVNQQIHWTPDHLKSGRFGKWLEGARDWAISRNRYWGTPIPIWKSSDVELLVLGSIAELEELSGKKVSDLHRHFIDELTITKNGKEFHRIPEVFDCWFESGSMPYAQNHYPFENKELFQEIFPADFIAEGLDQTRGWFYTLTVLSAALYQKPAFKNVIVNGIILAKDGAKMSKRLRNYPDPSLMIHKYGSDAIRLYMMHSPAVKAEDLRFKESGIELVLRQIMIPLWNAYSFFITYARICEWKPEIIENPSQVMDKWILSVLHKLIHEVEEGMDRYDLSLAVEPFVGFVDQLTNWYIRRSRRRFWEEEATRDRHQAFSTLYQVLLNLSKIAAPFVPFISEEIYRNLKSEGMPASVHLCDYPEYHEGIRDRDLEAAMSAVQVTVSLGHGLRKEHRLKVRQPLPKAHIASGNSQILGFLKHQKHLIEEELNVKEVTFTEDETELVKLEAKPNFRILGKKIGKLMPAAQKMIKELEQEKLELLFQGDPIEIILEGEAIALSPEDVEVHREVHEGMVAANAGEITIALETELTEDLILEGLCREIINKINTMRREQGMAVTDRIHVKIETTDKVKQSYDLYKTFIEKEVLALSVTFGPCDGKEWDLNRESTRIQITKA